MSSNVDISNLGKKVTNQKFAEFLKKKTMKLWNCTKDIFPSNSSVCLNREDFGKLKEYPYFVTYHTDDQSVMLFFTTDYFNNKVSFICDRKFNFYKIDINCYNDSVYLDSLFDCQLGVYQDGNYAIYVNDCVCLYGENLKNSFFDARLTNIDRFLSVDGICPPNNLYVFIKPFYKFEDISYFLKSLNVDMINGINLIPNKIPLTAGSQKNNFYWVKKGNHRVDLLVKELDNCVEIFCYNFRKPFKYAIGDNNLKNIIKELPGYEDNCIVEFVISETLFPLRVKNDKEYPCGLRIIESVLYSINEDIQLEELVDLLK